ncbi:DUF349 domain-containing protein [Hymenobacter jeollabukensis]|uniref:DUF349 domain-containing protein n=1 Tax=Hymenobacter jeollabukensis TaxID=2025313 RepID=A0A5R8WSY3_9BACT|nr:DUF349 domain-containing protein [Hymenobacter jeollabukensis]TLM93907.1 DUF349 domain-containing protein [Hymenobacter jeollabukensis]
MEQQTQLLTQARQFGYIEGDQVWLKPFMEFPARQVGQVKDTEDAALMYFAQRFESFRTKVDGLLARIDESENKGSFLMKALHLKEQIGAYDGLGDFTALHERLTEAEEQIRTLVSRNREKNLATKAKIIEEAEALHTSVDWQAGAEVLKDLRQAWIKTGPVAKELTDDMENRFQAAVEDFYTRKKAFQADKKAMTNRAFEKYKSLIHKSEALQNSDDWEGVTAQLKELQQQWKDVGGSLPRKTANDLWTRFRAAHNRFFDRLKEHISSKRSEAKDHYMDDNLTRKRDLVKEAEALVERPMHEAVARAKELQTAWKKVGPVRGPESDRVWEAFLSACDRVFELSSLEHYIRKRQPQEGPKPPADEQYAQRVAALKDFIKYDRQEQAVLEENLGKLTDTPGNEAFRSMLQSKIRAFERKIRTKNDLIEFLRLRYQQ